MWLDRSPNCSFLMSVFVQVIRSIQFFGVDGECWTMPTTVDLRLKILYLVISMKNGGVRSPPRSVFFFFVISMNNEALVHYSTEFRLSRFLLLEAFTIFHLD